MTYNIVSMAHNVSQHVTILWDIVKHCETLWPKSLLGRVASGVTWNWCSAPRIPSLWPVAIVMRANRGRASLAVTERKGVTLETAVAAPWYATTLHWNTYPPNGGHPLTSLETGRPRPGSSARAPTWVFDIVSQYFTMFTMLRNIVKHCETLWNIVHQVFGVPKKKLWPRACQRTAFDHTLQCHQTMLRLQKFNMTWFTMSTMTLNIVINIEKHCQSFSNHCSGCTPKKFDMKLRVFSQYSQQHCYVWSNSFFSFF
jgi:hypothetical protein